MLRFSTLARLKWVNFITLYMENNTVLRAQSKRGLLGDDGGRSKNIFLSRATSYT